MTSKILIDTDPGFDDSIALLLALSSCENRVFGAVSVFGNHYSRLTYSNLSYVVEIAKSLGGDNPLIAKGVDRPLIKKYSPFYKIHGKVGLGASQLEYTKHKTIVDFENVYKNFLNKNIPNKKILMLGPLTNLAKYLEKYPEMINKLPETVVMGGSFFTKGNYSESIEANFGHDPEAVSAVWGSAIKNVVIVPLDVTEKFVFDPAELINIKSKKLKNFIKISGETYFSYYKNNKNEPKVPIHDALAYIYTQKPEYFEVSYVGTRIKKDGQIVLDKDSSRKCFVVCSFNKSKVYNYFFKHMNFYT